MISPPSSSEFLYGGPRFFIAQPKQPSIKNIILNSALQTLINSSLATGIVFVASSSLPTALLVGGTVAVVTLVASIILQQRLYSQSYDPSLLNAIPDAQNEPEAFKRFVHLLACHDNFARDAKKKFEREHDEFGLELLKWIPQLDTLYLAQEMGDLQLKLDCEAFLSERFLRFESALSYTHTFNIACCYEASHWQQKILEGALRTHSESGFEGDARTFLDSHIEQLKALDFSNQVLTNENLYLINQKSQGLTHLTFQAQENFTNEKITYIGDLDQLRSLRLLGDAHLTDASIDILLNLTHLEELEIDCSHLTIQGLEALTRFPHLRHLTLKGGAHLPPEACEAIAQLMQLKHLELFNFITCNDQLQRLAPLSQLKSLVIGNDSHWHNQRQVELNYELLSSFSQLEKLAITPYQVDIGTLDALTSLRNLKSLALKITRGGDRALEALRGLTALEEIILTNCYDITPTGLAHLSSCPRLKTLDLTNVRISVSQLDLHAFSNLETLKLKNAHLANGIANLSHLSHLKVLDLARTDLKDEDLFQLQSLPNLAILDVSLNGDISQQGFAHIAREFKNLKELYCDLPVGEEWEVLHPLDSLKKLEKIGIRNFSRNERSLFFKNRLECLIVNASLEAGMR